MAGDPATRRDFLRLTKAAGVGLALAGAALPALANDPRKRQGQEAEEEVSPAEDLMREHGVLKRVLLVYGEAIRRIDARQDLPPEPVADAARLIRSFVEDYHEKLEEEHLFPRLEQAGKLVALVTTLRTQHQAGRRLSDAILAASAAGDARALAAPVHAFIRMYRPHAAREDTVLFPAFKALLPRHEYDELGERFEEREHQLFGAAGFEGIVDEVAAIEKTLGIDDLATFTPR